MSQFYVYIHRRANDGKIFYVGKGSGERLTKYDNRNIHWRRTVAKYGFTAHKVSNDMPEPCALSYEKALIAAIGRANLVNMTDGGDGISGYRFSDEQRADIGAKVKAAITPEMREAARQRRLGKPPATAGKPVTTETRAKISAANKGRRKPEGFGDKVSERQKGVGRPAHVIQAMREANLGRSLTDETKRKISEALTGPKCFWYGKKLSDEHRKKLSNARVGVGKKAVIRSDGMEFASAKDAALFMRGNGWPKAAATSITASCKGKQPRSYGFSWKYADE